MLYTVLFLCIVVFLVCVLWMKQRSSHKILCESFSNHAPRTDAESIFKKPYSDIYDLLMSYKEGIIIYQCDDVCDRARMDHFRTVQILDIGCGTGRHVCEFGKDYSTLGLDISEDMLTLAKQKNERFAKTRLLLGDMHTKEIIRSHFCTHITFFYFSFYYSANPKQVLDNCKQWLVEDGYLVLELVDRDKFDPVLEPANPFPLLSIQNYSSVRKTTSDIYFNDMTYHSDFIVHNEDICYFQEKLEFPTQSIENQHILYLPSLVKTMNLLEECGFTLQHTTHLSEINYNYHYLCYFQKKNLNH